LIIKRNDATSIVYASDEGKESIEHEVGERRKIDDVCDQGNSRKRLRRRAERSGAEKFRENRADVNCLEANGHDISPDCADNSGSYEDDMQKTFKEDMVRVTSVYCEKCEEKTLRSGRGKQICIHGKGCHQKYY